MSPVIADVKLLFHEIPRTVHTFSVMLHKLECFTVVEVCFSISQTCMHGLQVCLITFIMLASHMLFRRHKDMAVQRGQVQTSGRVGEHFPAKYFSFPEHQVCSMRECRVVLKNDVSFCRALVMKYTSQFLEHLNVENFIDSPITGQEIKQHPLASQSTVP
jgi:hypothetical protein